MSAPDPKYKIAPPPLPGELWKDYHNRTLGAELHNLRVNYRELEEKIVRKQRFITLLLLGYKILAILLLMNFLKTN